LDRTIFCGWRGDRAFELVLEPLVIEPYPTADCQWITTLH
jgi:hypothetical protein